MSKSLYPKFGETAGLKNGDRVVVSYEGVSASGDFVAGIGQQRFCVTLDGTGKMVTVDGWMITREKAGA
jgi:hypothetical protein